MGTTQLESVLYQVSLHEWCDSCELCMTIIYY